MKAIRKIFTFVPFAFCFFLNAGAQSEALNFLQAKVDSYNKKNLPEKLFVHTDKNFYSAGDILWFKIYAMDGFFNKPLQLSHVAYVELLNSENVSVASLKVGMDKEGGNGSIQLPLNITTGYYTLRSYTNWMKNGGPEGYFHKKILLFNPFRNIEQKGSEAPVQASISLFPEGGNLVYGIPSRLAYRLSGKEGKGLQAKGYLVNEKNDTISIFSPLKFGMGSFDITPQSYHQYRVVFIFDDNSIVAKPVTGILDKGYVMNVEEDEKQRITVSVRSNIQSGYPEIFMIASNRQITKAAKRNVLANGIASFVINKSDLGEGVSQITIFDNEKKPVCERLFFVQPSEKALAAIRTSGASYSKREKISLDIAFPSKGVSNASLAVFQADSLQSVSDADIVQYIWLNSELRGPIEDPGFYFSGRSAEVRSASDLLMLVNGWRRFSWDKVLGPDTKPDYLPESSGQKITARLTDTRDNIHAQGIQAYLSIPETKNKLYAGVSDQKGIVTFDVRDFYGAGEIILQTNQQKDSFYKIELLSPFSQTFLPSEQAIVGISPNHRSLLESYSVSMQAQHIYLDDSIRKFAVPELRDTFPFLGQPMYSYKLDNYSRFTTMEEVLREYVREINVGVKGGGNLKFKIFNEVDRELYSNDILVVVDGVPMFVPDRVFRLDPLKYRQLDVIPRNYILGATNFHGLASFSSYQGSYEDLELDKRAIIVDYEGLQLRREFYSPVYQTADQQNSRIPDLRTTLYWSGDVDSKKPVSFYAGDNKGKFIAVLQGLDQDGRPFSANTVFEVK